MSRFEQMKNGLNRFDAEKFPKRLWLLTAMIILLVIISYFSNIYIGLAMTILMFIVLYQLFDYWISYSDDINQYILDLSYRIKRGEQEAIIKMPIGILMYDENYEIEWVNPYLQSEISNESTLLGSKIEDVHEELNELVQDEITQGVSENIKVDAKKSDAVIKWDGEVYQVVIQTDVRSIYLLNVTKFADIKEKYLRSQPVMGWLFLDNYDEIVKGLDDRDVSSFDSLIATYLSNWAKQHHIYYKRLSDDKYLLLTEVEELKRLEEEKFGIVKNIREHTSKKNLPLTISIGMAYGDNSYNELESIAQKNLDLALSRGGDQAVVRSEDEKPRFYGGSTNPMEKRTRVRSRMVSQALQEQILQSPRTFVMGHKRPDLDAIGSSFGIGRIGMMLGKETKVVINPNDIGTDIQKLLEEVEKYEETASQIIAPEEALKEITEEDLVVMVDHHKLSLSIAPELLEKTDRYVIIDHHRRGGEFKKEPILVYIEPYASSAAELITEFFEYVPAEEKGINRIEATALLGGIIVDTNGFSLRTGSRTFNAASYLQSVGANTALIQRLLKESPDKYLERGEMIKTMEFVADGIAVAHGEEDHPHAQVMAAQTADTILGMADVEAAFVIVRLEDGRIGISARSLGSVNVQRVMEKLGGGGHLTNAATQIEAGSIEETKAQLIDVINDLNS